MKKKIILLSLFLIHLVAFPQMKKWVLGSSMWNQSGSLNSSLPGQLKFFEVDFSGTTPSFSQRTLGNTVNQIPSPGIYEGMTSVTDTLGNIAFYGFPHCKDAYSAGNYDTIFLIAFDQTTGKDEVFAKVAPSGLGVSSAKEIEIVKREGVNNQYYLIFKTTCINNFANDSWRYVIVDMNTKTISPQFILMSNSLNEGMAVSALTCSMRNHWLFFVKYDAGNLNLYRSSISATGISTPVLVTTLVIPGNNSLGQGEIEISPLVDKIAISNYTSAGIEQDVAILDLDATTGNVSNLRWIDNPQNYICSLEFSPNAKQLYAFSGGASGVTAEMFNIPVPTLGNYTITAADKLPVTIVAGHSLEIGYDGRLYFNTTAYNTALFYISNPNADAATNIINTTASNSYGTGNAVGFALPDQIDGVISPEKSITILQNDTTICKGSSLTLTASGGTTFQWTPGNKSTSSITVSPLGTTTYYLTASNGCTQFKDSVTIRIGSSPITLNAHDTIICKGQSVKFNVNGATSYEWSGGITSTASSITVSPLVTTTYYLNASNSCTNLKDTITVMVRNLPVAVITGNLTICSGQTTTLTASGGITYQWSGGSNATTPSITVKPTVITPYEVITSDGMCYSAKATAIVVVGDGIPINLNAHDTTTCKGQSINLHASGATSYQWSGGITSTASSITVTPLTTTTYYLNASNACTNFKDTITVTIRDLPVALVTGDVNICSGQATILTASGGTAYQWSGGSNATTASITVKPTVTTQYDVVAFDGMCYSPRTTLAVVVNSNPEISIIGKDTICSGSVATYNAIVKNGTSLYQFIWTNGSTSASASFSSITSKPLGVLVIDNNGCRDSASLDITVLTAPKAVLTGKVSGCSPVEVSFPNQSMYATLYKWNFGDGKSSVLKTPIHIYENPGAYNVTLIAQNYICADTITIKNYVFVLPSPKAAIAFSTNNMKDFEIYNHALSCDHCVLYFGDGDSLTGCSWTTILHNYLEDGEHTVTQILSNSNGCRDTATIKVISETEGTLFYPNSFTPDGDGLNDAFYAYGFNVKVFYMSIYDRWGQLIFQSSDINKGWDGSYKGQPAEQDLYVFKINYQLKRGRAKTIYGHVTLVK